MDRLKQFSLPLFAKELVELSARPRTYQVRVLYAAILLLISWIVLYSQIPAGATSALDVLGRGQPVMQGVGILQNIGLQLVLPAIACGVFTIEKERNTLSLLFLTRLGPWTILFEKLLSRLLLAVNFLLVSLPVLGFCYALGGINVDDLLSQVLSLCFTALYIVCISVMCSAYFRTTSSALLASYVLIFTARVVLSATWIGLTSGSAMLRWDIIWSVVFGGSSILLATIPPVGNSKLVSTAVMGIPWLIVSSVSILLARWFLVRRAFLAPRSPIKEFFRSLDRLFDRANNNRWTRGILVIRHSERLPDQDPVAWRETTTRSLGQARYLIRILLVLELPVLLLFAMCLALDFGEYRHVRDFAFMIQILVWLGMTLVICVLSAGLISGERGRQTLDVLLATPMDGREIVRQKMAGVMRLIWICEVPLWTCIAFRTLIEPDVMYLICQVSMLLIYPRLVAWIAMWHGLRSKTALTAVVKTLLAVLWRCVGPFVVLYCIAFLFFFSGPGDQGLLELLMSVTLLSPLTLLVVSEYIRDFTHDSGTPFVFRPAVTWTLTTLIQGGFLLWVRARCLDRANLLLGRTHEVVDSKLVEFVFPATDDPWAAAN